MNRSAPGVAPNALLETLEYGKEVTVQQVRDDFDLDRRQAYNAINRLENKKFVTYVRTFTWMPTEAGLKAKENGFSFSPGAYEPSGAVRQPKRSFRQRAWAAMRVRRYFTIGDIITDAACGDEKRPYDNAQRYVMQLRKGGVIGEFPRRQKGSAKGSNGFKQYVLLKDLGPKAPAYRAKASAIHDFNSGEDIPCVRP